jgi:hypothetical protein
MSRPETAVSKGLVRPLFEIDGRDEAAAEKIKALLAACAAAKLRERLEAASDSAPAA